VSLARIARRYAIIGGAIPLHPRIASPNRRFAPEGFLLSWPAMETRPALAGRARNAERAAMTPPPRFDAARPKRRSGCAA